MYPNQAWVDEGRGGIDANGTVMRRDVALSKQKSMAEYQSIRDWSITLPAGGHVT